MAKTNFSKVEESLRAGLHKMNVDELGKLADVAQSTSQPELKGFMEKAAKAAAKTSLDRKMTLFVVTQGIKDIAKAQFYLDIGISKEEIAEMLSRSKHLSREEWDKLKTIKNQMTALKEEYQRAHPENSNEQIVLQERKKHINKRFNIKEKWLPIK